jgi:hypothetical protein
MIALSQEKYNEIQAKINDLSEAINISESLGDKIRASIETYELKIWQEILSEAIILPVVNWGDTVQTLYTECANIDKFPDGVIINPK